VKSAFLHNGTPLQCVHQLAWVEKKTAVFFPKRKLPNCPEQGLVGP